MKAETNFEDFLARYAPAPAELKARALAAAVNVLAGGEQTVAREGRALTITTAAEKAGTSRTLIYRAISAGALSSFTPYAGANPRITEGELARWLAGRKGRA